MNRPCTLGKDDEELEKCEYPDSPEFFKPFRVKTLKEFPMNNGRGNVKAGTEAWGVMTPDRNIHLAPTKEASEFVIVAFHDGAVEGVDFERL